MDTVLIIVSITFVLAILGFIFPLVTIHGNSMYPTYVNGQKLRARRITSYEKLQIGAVYVFYSPVEEDKILIKRLTALSGTNYSRNVLCYFLGDNTDDSFDSRDFGYVSRKKIIAKIL